MKTKHQLFDATQELLHVQPKLEEVDKLKETVCIFFVCIILAVDVVDFSLLVYFTLLKKIYPVGVWPLCVTAMLENLKIGFWRSDEKATEASCCWCLIFARYFRFIRKLVQSKV